MDWGFVFTCLSLPASIYGIYELVKKGIHKSKNLNCKSIVWKNKTDWIIVVPKYTGNYRRVEDIIASEKIYTFCSELGLECVIQDDSQPIPADKNLILICGPKANNATSKLYQHFKIDFVERNGVTNFLDTLSKSNYESQINKNTNNIEKDFAVLSRYIDPNTKRIFIFCAGLHGLGTLGAANMLTGYKMAAYIKEYESFESIVSAEALDEYFSIGAVDFVIPPRKL